MIRRVLVLACAALAAITVSADRAGAQANPAGAAVQAFKPSDIKWVRNAAGTQERAVLFGDPKLNRASTRGQKLVRELVHAYCAYLGAPPDQDKS